MSFVPVCHIVSLATAVPILAAPSYIQYPEVQAFIQGMVQNHGFDEASLKGLFAGVQPNSRILELAAPHHPVRVKNWRMYHSRFLDKAHVRAAAVFWRKHVEVLERAEREYGVPADYIVGILGVETLYGCHMGSFPVLTTLINLSFDYPDAPNRDIRVALFRQQLSEFLIMCREQHHDPCDYVGSYTGAIGIAQFLPESIRSYAVDFDGDGRVDLRNSEIDAIGSVARFLQMHGWERDRPVLWRIREDAHAKKVLASLADGDPLPRHRLGDLLDAGVKPVASRSELQAELDAQVILVDLPTPRNPTEYRIGFRNFYVLTRYNHSFFYAEAVSELGHAARLEFNSQRSRSSSAGGSIRE